ncbi:MAG TPA: hypothetical protein VFG63_01300 [Nocardioidaceae bacterium]|nr:hypothetical protein [Nocardioidaceae bacterium]
MGHKPTDDPNSPPSLELPSLRLPGRGRNKKPQPEAEPAAAPERELGAPTPPPARDRFALPVIPGPLAAILTGLVVGAFGAVLTYLGMAGCEAVKGTSTCGDPGFFLLVAILVLMVLLGLLLLKAWQVGDPGSTSFLAVGLVAVIVLLTLVDVIFSAWMFLVVPLVGAAAYALAHWVTTRFVEQVEEGPPPHDVR